MASISEIRRRHLTAAAAAVSASVLLMMFFLSGPGGTLRFIPLIIVMPAAVYVMAGTRRKGYDAKRLMNESSTVIGMMAVRIRSGESLESAVRDVAENGPRLSAKLFSGIVRNTDLRIVPDMCDGLNSAMSLMGKELAPFRRGLHMMISASGSKDQNERKRMIRDAENISLTGLKELGESYGSGLNNPCMMIFGLGVMVPMILMSIVPMLSIGGLFSASVLSTGTVAFITLIAIPGIVTTVVAAVVSGNPFTEKRPWKDEIVYALPLIASVPAFLILYLSGTDTLHAILITAVPMGLFSFLLACPRMTAEKRKKRTAVALDHLLFDLGNRLLAGENFETAVVRALKSGKETSLASTVGRAMMMSRGDAAWTLYSCLSPYSTGTADVYVKIYEASVKDTREAGRLAVSVGHQVQDRASVEKGIGNKLKNMTDMMNATAVVFAPLIMGLSIVLLKPLSSVVGTAGQGSVSVVLAVYLIELSLLIAVLTSYLVNKGGVLNVTYRFGIMMPAALIVFAIFSGLSI